MTLLDDTHNIIISAVSLIISRSLSLDENAPKLITVHNHPEHISSR